MNQGNLATKATKVHWMPTHGFANVWGQNRRTPMWSSSSTSCSNTAGSSGCRCLNMAANITCSWKTIQTQLSNDCSHPAFSKSTFPPAYEKPRLSAGLQRVKKVPRRVCRRKRQIKLNPFSAGACTWTKILLRLQVYDLCAAGAQGVRATGLDYTMERASSSRHPADAHWASALRWVRVLFTGHKKDTPKGASR